VDTSQDLGGGGNTVGAVVDEVEFITNTREASKKKNICTLNIKRASEGGRVEKFATLLSNARTRIM
jgi:phosphomevalonate kinase